MYKQAHEKKTPFPFGVTGTVILRDAGDVRIVHGLTIGVEGCVCEWVELHAKINPTDALMGDRRGADGRGGGLAGGTSHGRAASRGSARAY